MTDQKRFTPLNIGLLTVVLSYFLFTLHSMFTLQWIGEWDRFGGTGAFRFMIMIEDVTAGVGLIFRLAASLIAIVTLAVYLTRGMSKPSGFKILRVVLVLEGIYWLGLAVSAYYSAVSFWRILFHHTTIMPVLNNFAISFVPTVMEAIVFPIVLFIFAATLNPNKPLKTPIKWALISGTTLIVVFWLVNMSIWLGVVNSPQKGFGYLTAYPEHLVSYALTVFGLLILSIYAAYVTKKSWDAQTLGQVDFKKVGVLILALGLYFLWNYISWVLFAGDTWNDW